MNTVEEKIAQVIDKVRNMKEEKDIIEKRNRELEELLRLREQEIGKLSSEKEGIKAQIEALLKELEGFELK
ncbi:MAG TPA: hypothetical protein VMB78_07790 [Dissulfurispiraceae bacterium]|nr:hypothetical protein [Dissulfurispiraceae bacterium]